MKTGLQEGKSLFDHLNMITKTQDPNYFNTLSDKDKKSWSSFMILKYLSMNPDWVETINNLQPIIVGNQLKPEFAYQVLITIIPPSRVFLQYVKNKNEVNYSKELIQLFIDHYNLSKNEALDYLNILYVISDGMIEVQRILKLYGHDEKEIKKITKVK